ncbi:hypothetical protein HPB49_014608 [Dermacentor silvarum]|uniref:Uncharacterized protein n=1 Tax=Dermacentor silvarum TaxID=543639 RepID=A0ACB8CL76_DERSI|nr:hypothetical protein HPB49_014608 [Dermacentor silvarum]
MTVYARPKHFVFNFSRAAEELATTFVCEATGAFPLPTLSLYQLDEGSSASPPRRHALAPTQRVTPRQDGSYVTRVSSQVPDEQFSHSGRHLFVCLLSIPGTDFKKQRLIEFYPAPHILRHAQAVSVATFKGTEVPDGAFATWQLNCVGPAFPCTQTQTQRRGDVNLCAASSTMCTHSVEAYLTFLSAILTAFERNMGVAVGKRD